jgi:hypothetical protein
MSRLNILEIRLSECPVWFGHSCPIAFDFAFDLAFDLDHDNLSNVQPTTVTGSTAEELCRNAGQLSQQSLDGYYRPV